VIIEIEGHTVEEVTAAQHGIGELARDWGHETTVLPSDAPSATRTSPSEDKAIDPVSVTALVLSIPSAALAAIDLADRIHKRRRAQQLINHARELAEQDVALRVIAQERPIELTALDPDQLLDLLTDDTSD
jgi:hypothetical protein